MNKSFYDKSLDIHTFKSCRGLTELEDKIIYCQNEAEDNRNYCKSCRSKYFTRSYTRRKSNFSNKDVEQIIFHDYYIKPTKV